jgi:ribonuclease P protein component
MAGPSCHAGALVAGTSSRLATREPSGLRKPAKATSSGGALTFPKTSRILRSADYRIIYDNGIRVSSPMFAAFCLARDSHQEAATGAGPDTGNASGPRLGLTTPRALGVSVVRNRIKRRLREAFRLHRAEFGSRWDIVINPRRAALTASFDEIERALKKVIEKCGHS